MAWTLPKPQVAGVGSHRDPSRFGDRWLRSSQGHSSEWALGATENSEFTFALIHSLH
jgi:hypothetical protein